MKIYIRIPLGKEQQTDNLPGIHENFGFSKTTKKGKEKKEGRREGGRKERKRQRKNEPFLDKRCVFSTHRYSLSKKCTRYMCI
jgi:hypothetical protein